MGTEIDNTEQDNLGVWYRKSNWKDFYLNYDPDVVPEGCTRVEPLENVEYQKFDEEAGEWAVDTEAARQAEIGVIKAAIDRKAGAGRAVRGLALAAAAAAGIEGEDYARLLEYEDQAAALRQQLGGE